MTTAWKCLPAAAAALFVLASLPAEAQVSSNPNAVRPNSQNLSTGPSTWTPGQRRLNVPGATSNPSLRKPSISRPPAQTQPQSQPCAASNPNCRPARP